MKEHFEKILGPAGVSENPSDLESYSYDASELPGRARMVLFPKSDEDLRAILTYCNRSNLDAIVRGNGTSQTGAATPQNSIVILTQGFDRIHSINLRDGWVHVDCGVTVHELNEALKPHGYQYPLTNTSKKMTTIGGLLAINGWSKYSGKYGRPGQTVLELEIMDGTGKYFTVKDGAEYTGLEGTCVIILRAKLHITPIIDRSTDVAYFDNLHEAIEHIEQQIEKKPLAVEFLDSISATLAGLNTKHTVITEYDDERGAHKYENYQSIVARRDSARRMVGGRGFVLLEDGRVAPGKLLEAIDWCVRHELPVTAHAQVGVVHPYFSREQEKLREAWLDWLAQNGEVAGEHGYGVRKKAYAPQEIKLKMRRLKERYDYNNILGRGKVSDYI